jgi:phosphopantothenoylcysteine decarboxylase/phosphopantothenate--cysteine ligase
MSRILDAKHVLLGVGGGIAAYKAAEVVRALVGEGAEVQVAMTTAAREFITPLTLQTLSRRRVATEILDAGEDAAIGHIEIADRCDAVLIAPATADLIARLAAGMANDMVTAAVLATRAPVVLAPAMNSNMLAHPAVRENLSRLESYGYTVVEPDAGELACGHHGPGRLPDPSRLLEAVATVLADKDLSGRHVVVSAGPTREPIDPVRCITNRSSGRMGYAVAAAAVRRGAAVRLVSGPTSISPPYGCEFVRVETAGEMAREIEAAARGADVVVMVAAVADYTPSSVAAQKIKKKGERLELTLERTTDILGSLRNLEGERLLVGFAAETERVREHAREKLERKGLDLIVANDVSGDDRGFDVEMNAAVLIDRSGGEEETGLVTKAELADRVLDRVAVLLGEGGSRGGRRLQVRK